MQITHEVYFHEQLDRLSPDIAKKLVSIIKQTLQDIAIKIADSEAEKIYNARLEKELKLMLERLNYNLSEELEKNLIDIADITQKRYAKLYTDIYKPSRFQLQEYLKTGMLGDGTLLNEAITKWNINIDEKIMKALRLGFMEGEGIAKIIDRILGKDFTADLYKIVRTQTRTAVMAVSNAVKENIYKENADIIEKIMIISTLDKDTCIVCGSLDGKMYDINEGIRPPFHPNCRCTTVPITQNTELQEFTRASEDGYTSANYRQYFESLSDAEKKDILGAGRYEMYQSGMIKDIGSYTINARLITVDELKAYYNL